MCCKGYNKRSIKYIIPGQLHGEKAKTGAPPTVTDMVGIMTSKYASSVLVPVDTVERRATLNVCVHKRQEKGSWIQV